jgi:hypothetical protein
VRSEDQWIIGRAEHSVIEEPARSSLNLHINVNVKASRREKIVSQPTRAARLRRLNARRPVGSLPVTRETSSVTSAISGAW